MLSDRMEQPSGSVNLADRRLHVIYRGFTPHADSEYLFSTDLNDPLSTPVAHQR